MSPTPQIVTELVEKFERNIHEYRNPKYNETLIRVEFVNPFWKALGWDVDNEKGYALAYRDVIHEDELKVGRTTRAPDYAFRIGGTRKFFLETKKPAVDLKRDPAPAFQLRRYAYSARLPISMLTDFEEFIVYDCRIKPAITDKPHIGRMMYYTYREYLEKWDEISGIFSKEAVLQGAFDRFIIDTQGKRPRAEIDRDFLNDLDKWRITFARNIALRNPELTERELNYAVQLTIDRLIFLRMCEDRDIEQYETLMTLLNGVNIYRRLVEFFYKADVRYNSGLFHFEAKDGPHPDMLTPKLNMDDKVLKEIISELYYPQCPYEFSVLPVEVLGNAYEQFLGKRITLTEGHRARIEEKPEVRKAGGVYYTPQYIVDYIVKNTVGKLCENKTLREISELRILDPACGSGSFLLGAYQYLLDWHLNWYRTDYENTGKILTSPPAKGVRKRKSDSQAIFQGKGGEWYLTTAEKKRILTNNIYGVDIDANAVEVTKLSLLLKMLEHETSETLNQQLRLWKERALPNLESNIKCGNSLIGTDFYEGRQAALFNEDETLRVNVFDWEQEFADIFANGGFDAVIGNPPYIRIQTMKEWAPFEVEIYKEKYTAASSGNYDIYVVFVEKGLRLLNTHGLLGFILPHKFFNAKYGKTLRGLLAEDNNLSQVVHFGDQQVFVGATTYTCMLFLEKAGSEGCQFIKVDNLAKWRSTGNATEGVVPAQKITANEWHFVVGKNAAIFEKLDSIPTKLGEITNKIYQGLVTGADSVFILKNIREGYFYSKATQQEHKIESELMHSLCKGSLNVRRYHITMPNKSILFPYKLITDKADLISVKELTEKYPNAWNYLKINRNLLESRERGKWKHNKWYAFGRSQNLSQMEHIKIMTPSIANRASFTFDSNKRFYFVGSGGGGGGGYGITLKEDEQMAYEYILGLLNSKLLDTFLKSFSSRFSGGYYAYNRQYIEQLPVRTINFSNSSERKHHDFLVKLVVKIMQLFDRMTKTRIVHEKKLIQRQIDATDRQIDQLVYQLYGLNDEEIRIVENDVIR